MVFIVSPSLPETKAILRVSGKGGLRPGGQGVCLFRFDSAEETGLARDLVSVGLGLVGALVRGAGLVEVGNGRRRGGCWWGS